RMAIPIAGPRQRQPPLEQPPGLVVLTELAQAAGQVAEVDAETRMLAAELRLADRECPSQRGLRACRVALVEARQAHVVPGRADVRMVVAKHRPADGQRLEQQRLR